MVNLWQTDNLNVNNGEPQMDDRQLQGNPVGILVIAAGHGRRFTAAGGETDKLLAEFSDASGRAGRVFEHSCRAALQSQLPVCVVTRPAQHAIQRYCQQQGIPVVLVENDRMGESIAAGVRRMSGWRGWLIHLADMPFISAAVLQQMAKEITDEGIVRPTFGGQPGHPVGFGRSTQAALSQLTAEHGARDLLTQFPLHTVELDDEAILRDIDLPSQLPDKK